MANKYAIESIYKLIDQVTAPANKIGRSLDKMGIKSRTISNALKNDFDKASARIDKLGKSITKWGKRAALAGAAAVGAGLAIATKQYVEFDNALQKAGAVFSDLDSQTLNFKDALKSLGKEARAVAAATEFNATQTASALATMAMAGIKSEQAIALLPKVADMATAAGVDIDQAVGMAAGALNVFGKMTDDPLKLAQNLQYVSDIMVKTSSLANMSLSDMSAAVSAGGAEFKKINQSIENFGAAVDVLASSNIRGAEAGNSLNTIMIKLSAPVKKAQDAMASLGLRTRDTRGNLLNFVDIIGQLESAFKGMGTAQQLQFIDAIFGKNQSQAAGALITAGADALRNYTEQLQNATGATAQMAGVMRESLSNRIEVLKSSLMELGFKFIDAFSEKGGQAIEKLTNAINNFDVTPIVDFVQTVGNAIIGFVNVLIGAVKMAWQFRYAILAILAPIALYNAALMGITIASRIHVKWQGIMKAANYFAALSTQTQTSATVGLTAALSGLTLKTIAHAIAEKAHAIGTAMITAGKFAYSVALGVATAAQWAFNAALTANPIGVIIVAIGALIAGIVLLAKNWDKVTTAIKNNVNKIMAVLSVVTGPIGFIISMIKEVVANFGRIKDALAATGLFDKIKEIAGAIKGFFQPAIDWLINAFDTVKNAVTGFFSGIANKIRDFFMPAITAVSGFFQSIFGAIYNFVKPALDWLGEKWQEIVSFFKDNAIINAIKVIGGVLLSGILAPVQGLLEILSYIPGLGHLAGKGAAKIQEFRNFLTGKSGEDVTKTSPPKKALANLSPVADASPTPDFAGQGYSGGYSGAAGKSKLHGVIDISGAIPGIPGADFVRTATGGASRISGGMPDAITRTVFDIAAILRRIEGGVSTIMRGIPTIGVPKTITRMSGAENAADYQNPRSIAPVTQGERMAYSYSERVEKLIIEVAAEKGTAARIVRAPRDAEISLVNSGGNT